MQYVVAQLKPVAIRKALDEPDWFLSSLELSPAAKRLLLVKLKPHLEPFLEKIPMPWRISAPKSFTMSFTMSFGLGDALPVLEEVQLEDLKAALSDPLSSMALT